MTTRDVWAWHREQVLLQRKQIQDLNAAREARIQRRVDYMVDRLRERHDQAPEIVCVDEMTKMGKRP